MGIVTCGVRLAEDGRSGGYVCRPGCVEASCFEVWGGGWKGFRGVFRGVLGCEGAKKRLHICRFRGKMSKLGNFHFGDSKYATTRVLVDGDGDYGWYVLLTEGNG